MARMHTGRYLLEIRNADGVVLFSGKADWTDKKRRVAFAQKIAEAQRGNHLSRLGPSRTCRLGRPHILPEVPTHGIEFRL